MNRTLLASLAGATLWLAGISVALAANCGDSAGRKGRDAQCRCGDTVVTDTVLRSADPVTRKTCPAGGLTVAAGITLDLGQRVLSGNGLDAGIRTAAGATIRNGIVQRFETGALVDNGTVVLTDVKLDANVGSGLVISPAAGAAPVATLGGPLASVSDNGSSGIVVESGATLEIAGHSLESRLPILRNGDLGMDVRGQLLATNVQVGESASHGVLVESLAPVKLVGVQVNGNGGDGIHVLGAPGASNLDDVTHDMEFDDYGFVLESSTVQDNVRSGVHLGDAAQSVDVAARIGGATNTNEISGNLGVGILLEQNVGLAQGDDCGVSAGYPGCTGATIVNNRIHDNTGTGVELRSGFIIPLFVPGVIELGLGFVQNFVSHNAMAGPGCDVSQSAPQIFVTGPVGLSNAACAAFIGDPEACEDNVGYDGHCVPAGQNCFVAWDLRGDTEGQCPNGLRNAIFGYNTGNTIPGDDDSKTVGIRAINNSHVDASNNEWQHTTSSQNVTQGAGSFVQAEITCGTRGCGSN